MDNSATATDADGNTDTGEDSVSIIEVVDLEVVKDFAGANPESVTAGSTGNTFTITVTNNGPSNADDVQLTDPVDARLNVAGVSTNTGTCAAPAQLVSCDLNDLAPGASAVITVTYSVAAGRGPGLVDNSATATDADGNTDTDADTVVVAEDVDLEITKTFADDEVTAGAAGTHTFSLLVENLGDSDADNVTITDTAPAGLTFLSENSADCEITLAGNLGCSFAHLGPNSSTTIVVTYDVPATTNAGTITNSATVASDEDTDTDADTVVVAEDVDLEITKTFADDEVTAGAAGTHTFSLLVENLGDSDADNVTITDTAPAGLTFLSENSANCEITLAGNLSCSFAHLGPNSSTTIVVTYDVPATTNAGTITNSATVASDEDTDTDADTVVVAEDVDLEITKTFADDEVTAGAAGTHTFSLLVENLGDSDADNVTITDTAPAGLTFLSENSADCEITLAGNLSCSFAHLGPNSSTTIVVTYDVPATTNAGTITNSATVASDEDTDTDADTVVVAEDVDLEITKTFADDEVTAGAAGTHTFSLLVENLGDSDADNVTITDTAPAGLTFLSENSADCEITLAGNLSCSFAHLGPNSSTTIVVTYDVPATTNAGTITNSATVASDEDTDTDADTVVVAEDVDLEITKTFADDEVTAGAAGTHTFSLLVENLGDSDADNVTITDTAPAGLTFLSENSADCEITLAGNLSCSFAHLGPNSSTTIVVTYDVPATTNAGTITNSATVASDEDTDTDADTVVVAEDVDLEITKTFADDEVTAGAAGTHTFSLLVENLGDSDADNVTITDTAPAGLTFLSENSADCEITLAGTSAAPSPTWGRTPRRRSSSPTTCRPRPTPGRSRASATVASDEDTDTDADTVAVAEDVDLEITKTFADDEVTAGAAGTHTFSLLVENLGDSDADNVTITDTAPAGLTFLSENSADCEITLAGNLSCSFAHLGPNSSTTIVVTYDVPATTNAGTITNSATVASDEDTDTDADTVEVIEDVQLSIDKEFSDTSVVAGTSGHTFTLVVSNGGASDADNVLVTDTVDSRLHVTNVSAPAGVDCSASAGQSVSCSKTHLATGGSFTITVTYEVASTVDAAASVSNTGSVASDEDSANDTDTVAITREADLSIAKTDGTTTVAAGTSTTYAITLTNNGPSSVGAGVVIKDAIPANTTPSETELDCSISGGVRRPAPRRPSFSRVSRSRTP